MLPDIGAGICVFLQLELVPANATDGRAVQRGRWADWG